MPGIGALDCADFQVMIRHEAGLTQLLEVQRRVIPHPLGGESNVEWLSTVVLCITVGDASKCPASECVCGFNIPMEQDNKWKDASNAYLEITNGPIIKTR